VADAFLIETVRTIVPAAPPPWCGPMESWDARQVGALALLAAVVVVAPPELLLVVTDPPEVVVVGCVVVVEDRWVVVDVDDADVAPDEHAANTAPPATTASTAASSARPCGRPPALRGPGWLLPTLTSRSLQA
jgi:hypothetical protein